MALLQKSSPWTPGQARTKAHNERNLELLAHEQFVHLLRLGVGDDPLHPIFLALLLCQRANG
jgi:hypothetical protein